MHAVMSKPGASLSGPLAPKPSTWVEPVGNWGRGAIRLIEIPTPDETNDNIVAFWQPETLPAVGEPLVLGALRRFAAALTRKLSARLPVEES